MVAATSAKARRSDVSGRPPYGPTGSLSLCRPDTSIDGESYGSLVANIGVDRLDFYGSSRPFDVDISVVEPSGRHTYRDALGGKPFDDLTTKETRTAEDGHAAQS